MSESPDQGHTVAGVVDALACAIATELNAYHNEARMELELSMREESQDILRDVDIRAHYIEHHYTDTHRRFFDGGKAHAVARQFFHDNSPMIQGGRWPDGSVKIMTEATIKRTDSEDYMSAFLWCTNPSTPKPSRRIDDALGNAKPTGEQRHAARH